MLDALPGQLISLTNEADKGQLNWREFFVTFKMIRRARRTVSRSWFELQPKHREDLINFSRRQPLIHKKLQAIPIQHRLAWSGLPFTILDPMMAGLANTIAERAAEEARRANVIIQLYNAAEPANGEQVRSASNEEYITLSTDQIRTRSW